MSLATGLDFGGDLIESLGLRDQQVTKIVLVVEANKIVKVHVTRYVNDVQSTKVLALFKDTKLVDPTDVNNPQ